jgi:hypothetical protein
MLASTGAFMVAFGALLHFYVAPQLVAAPASIYLQDVLQAPHSTYFDQASLTEQHNALLTFTTTVRGDPAASTSKIAVWDSYSVLADKARNVIVTSGYQRSAFNRRTGELTNCCGASLNDNTQLPQHGIGLFWPIDGLRKATYPVFNANAASTWPATFTGVTDVDGVTAYRYEQHIPTLEVTQMAGVPSSLLGLPARDGNVVAGEFYQADNSFTVDPRTGIVIDITEKISTVLHGPGGKGTLVAADLDLKLTRASIVSLAALTNKTAMQIALVRETGPIGLGGLGLVLILVATVRFRRRRPEPDDDGYEPDDDGYERQWA